MDRLRRFRTLSAAVALVWGLLACSLARAETSTPWPQMVLPPRAKVEWIASSMKVNGIPMRVMKFESEASRSEVVAYYTAHWTGGYSTKPSVTPTADATVVGQAHGPYYMTVKVGDRPHDRSAGWIAVSQILGNRVDLSVRGLPLMPGAKVVSVVESEDPGMVARQVLIVQDAGVDSAMKFYETALQGAGWQQIQKTISTAPHVGPNASMAVFQRDQSQLSISAAQLKGQRGSSIDANLVTKGTGLSTE
jgi:hypothetical protein